MKAHSLLAALLLPSLTIARTDEKPDPRQTFRNTTVSVPKLKQAPSDSADAMRFGCPAVPPCFTATLPA